MKQTITVLGKRYGLQYKNLIGNDSSQLGRHYGGEGIIEISVKTSENNDRCKDEIDTTLIHEVVHAIFNRQGIRQDEETVTLLSIGLHDFIKNNKGVIKRIMKE